MLAGYMVLRRAMLSPIQLVGVGSLQAMTSSGVIARDSKRETAAVEQNGAVGKSGRLGARLAYLVLPLGRIPLRGKYADRGDGNGSGVVLAVVGFGLPSLLNGRESTRLKAGDRFTGHVEGHLR